MMCYFSFSWLENPA